MHFPTGFAPLSLPPDRALLPDTGTGAFLLESIMWHLAILTVIGVVVFHQTLVGLHSAMEILGFGEFAFLGILLGILIQVVASSFNRVPTRCKARE